MIIRMIRMNLIGHSRYRAVSEELSELVPDAMTVLGSWDAPDEAVVEHNRRELHLRADQLNANMCEN